LNKFPISKISVEGLHGERNSMNEGSHTLIEALPRNWSENLGA